MLPDLSGVMDKLPASQPLNAAGPSNAGLSAGGGLKLVSAPNSLLAPSNGDVHNPTQREVHRAFEEGLKAGREIYSPLAGASPSLASVASPRATGVDSQNQATAYKAFEEGIKACTQQTVNQAFEKGIKSMREEQQVFEKGIKSLREEQQAFLQQFQKLLRDQQQSFQSKDVSTNVDAEKMMKAPPSVPLAPVVVNTPRNDTEKWPLSEKPSVKDSIEPTLALARSMKATKIHQSVLKRRVDLSEHETDVDADNDLQMLEQLGKRKSRLEEHGLTEKNFQDVPPYEKFRMIVLSDRFELTFGVVILVNTVVMAAEMQYAGDSVGADMSYPLTTRPPTWLGNLVDVLNECILWAFVVELLCKLLALKLQFFTTNKLWNYMDLFVVVTGVIDRFFTIDVGIDPLILRLLRLMKLTRFLKMFKMAGSLQTMKLILKSVAASRQTLLWSMLLLFMLQCVAGMFVAQLSLGFIRDTSNDMAKRHKVFQYYGTFTKSQFTMFEVTHVNYSRAARVLTDNVSEWWAWFFIAYRVGIAFAFLQCVRAIFIQSTLKVADQDRELMLHNKRRQQQSTIDKLRDMFTALVGADDNGKLTETKFKSACRLDATKVWFSALDIDCSDPSDMWDLLDLDGNGSIGIEEFSAAAAKLRGPAQTMDIYFLQSLTERIESKLDILLPNEFRGHTWGLASQLSGDSLAN